MIQTIMTKIRAVLIAAAVLSALPLPLQAKSHATFDLKAYLDPLIEKAAEGDPESYLLVLYAIEHFDLDAEQLLTNDQTLTALSQSTALTDFRVIAALGVSGYINAGTICFELEQKNRDVKCDITRTFEPELLTRLERSGIFASEIFGGTKKDAIHYLLNGSPSDALEYLGINENYDFLASIRLLEYGFCFPKSRVNEILQMRYSYLLDNCNQERPVTENDVEELAKNSEISAGFANYCLSHKQDWECFRTISQLVIVGTCRKPDINALSEFEYYRSPYFHACLDQLRYLGKEK